MISLLSIAVLITVVSFSYAYIKTNKEEKDVNVLGTECINLEMEDLSKGITLQHTFPVSDATGKSSTPYTFKLTNECGVGVDYEIHLRVEDVEEGQKKIAAKNIATMIDSNEKVVLTSEKKVINEEESDKEEYKISSEKLTLEAYQEIEHEVRIWLDESAGNDSQNGIFKSKIVIEAIQNQTASIYKETILHGADPVLNNEEEPIAMLTANEVAEAPTTTDQLIPVTIDETTGEVKRADLYTEWYDYETKKWANAVILVDNNKANEIQPGQTIQENDIESYFVWIPKYSYKLFDMGNTETTVTNVAKKEKPIEIRFGTTNTSDSVSDECKTPTTSGEIGTCQVGDWMTHPAFLAFDADGLWVGKFETGYEGADSTANANKNEVSPNKVIIKPNVYSWRNITVGNAFKTAKNYEPTLQSHMMKNTEWGAVAYLSHSIYGTCDGSSCTEIRINNSSSYLTGVSAKTVPDSGWNQYNGYAVTTPNTENDKSYVYPKSQKSSTTFNNTGIFDMSGGSWEYVMGYMSGNVGSSGLTEETDLTEANSKYFDKYENKTDTEWSKRILGDATGELEPFGMKQYNTSNNRINSWYEDWAWFPNSSLPWFKRGGARYDGVTAGVFAFSRHTGAVDGSDSFRLVCAPTHASA